MIAYLRGILAEIEMDYILMEVNGVGYQVYLHNRAFNFLPSVGENLLIYTYLQITDNEYRLFGFMNKDEISLFEKVISVSGIGPRVANNILSAIEPATFCRAILNQDEKTLTTIPGIGKKSAARLIFELKEKLSDFLVEAPITNDDVNILDIVEAMEVLGYHRQELMPIINTLINQNKLETDTSFNVKLVLKEINLKNLNR